tara:strand:+ start:189 stop:524 length:336 start_codon:yes stop_codon:yes gene_type:complete
MPNYDYICESCGHSWEMFQSMNDNPAKTCPKCKKRKARRQIGLGAGIIFKGSGFYETDYKRSGEKEKKESKSESESSSNTDKSSGSENKKAKPKESSGSSSEKKTETKKSS